MMWTEFWSYVVTLTLWIAAILQLAVIRDKTIYVTRASASSRWLICAGLVGFAGRFSFFIYDHGQLDVPLYALLSIECVGIGLVGLELPRFAPFHFLDTRPGVPLDDDGPHDRRRHADRRHDRRTTTVHTPNERNQP